MIIGNMVIQLKSKYTCLFKTIFTKNVGSQKVFSVLQLKIFL